MGPQFSFMGEAAMHHRRMLMAGYGMDRRKGICEGGLAQIDLGDTEGGDWA